MGKLFGGDVMSRVVVLRRRVRGTSEWASDGGEGRLRTLDSSEISLQTAEPNRNPCFTVGSD